MTAPASADPIVISGGTFTAGGGAPSWFNVSGTGFTGQGRDRDADPARLSMLGGGMFSLASNFNDDFPLSQVVYNGHNYGNVWLDTTFNVSAAAGSNSFLMTGTVTGYAWDSSNPERGSVLFTRDFQGSGTANVSFGQSGPTIVYNFGGSANQSLANASSVVTPEPASLLLLGSGLALVGARLRGRKRAAERQ